MFEYFYDQAAIDCADNKVPEMCQALGNLCVLALYDQLHPACLAFKKIAGGTIKDGF